MPRPVPVWTVDEDFSGDPYDRPVDVMDRYYHGACSCGCGVERTEDGFECRGDCGIVTPVR